MPSCLDQLKQWSTVVADTGDFDQIKLFNPQDATTNPSLVLQAFELPVYKELTNRIIQQVKSELSGKSSQEMLHEAIDRLGVAFGCEILKVVPGVVSTEIDSSLSFDTEGSVARARKIIALYQKEGYGKDRVLIKMATTWEGCQASKILEQEGIHTNMTLVFSLGQAVAAAEAGSYLISPFVGRILDWHKKQFPTNAFSGLEDPGVISVTEIYNYYKLHGYKTIVMGASFRSVEEVKNLAGCDRLTIAPKLLKELQEEECTASFVKRLSSDNQKENEVKKSAKIVMDEKTFRWMLNEDAMATEKLAEGIRNFTKDTQKLMGKISTLL